MASAIAVTLLVLPTMGVAAAAPAPGAGIGIALADAPTSERGDPRAQIYIIDQLRAGTTIRRHVRITNSTTVRRVVSLYAAAATIAGGRFRFADARTANELSGWTSVAPARVTLAPGAVSTPLVTIRVPAGAVSGERYAVVWAQTLSAPNTGSIAQVNRVGVRIYLDVSGAKPDATEFQITNLTATRSASGAPVLTAVVRDSGLRAIDLSGQGNLSDGPSALRAGPIALDKAVTIAPGGTQPVSFTFDRALPRGPWHAVIQVVSGTTTRTATGDLTFPASAMVKNPAASAKDSASGGLAWIWLLAGAVLLLLLLLLLLAARRRRHTARPGTSGPNNPTRPMPGRR